MPFPFDATLKDMATEYPADCRAVFDGTDRPVRVLNADLSTISAATDVALGLGEPLEEILDINFQSGPDRYLAGRVEMYRAVIHNRYHVAVRSIIVLLRPEADHGHLTGIHSYGRDNNRVECRHEVFRVWEHSADSFLNGGLGMLPVAVLAQVSAQSFESRMDEIVKTIEHRLATECDEAAALRIMRATYILSGLRLTESERMRVFKGVPIMTKLADWEDTVQKFLNFRRDAILSLGKKKFGSPSHEAKDTIFQIDDSDRLDRMLLAVLTANDWEELLATS